MQVPVGSRSSFLEFRSRFSAGSVSTSHVRFFGQHGDSDFAKVPIISRASPFSLVPFLSATNGSHLFPHMSPMPTSFARLRALGVISIFLDTTRPCQPATRCVLFLDGLGHVPGTLWFGLVGSVIGRFPNLSIFFLSYRFVILPFPFVSGICRSVPGTYVSTSFASIKKQLLLNLFLLLFTHGYDPVPPSYCIKVGGTCNGPAVVALRMSKFVPSLGAHSGAIRIASGRDIDRLDLVQRRGIRMHCGCSTEPSRWWCRYAQATLKASELAMLQSNLVWQSSKPAKLGEAGGLNNAKWVR